MLKCRAVTDAPRELTAQLERALVRELARAWHVLNQTHFKGALRPPTFALVASSAHLGRWIPATRTLEISRPLVLSSAWGVVIEVVKHEMAHQYAHEVLRAHDETAHGPAFRSICARLGIDASAAGLPSAAHSTQRHGKMIERIAKLLALAESPNVHEAEAAMAAAQRLMLKYNLELRDAPAGSKSYAFKHLGRATGRTTEGERILAMILGTHFFVEAIWVPVYRPLDGKRGSVLEVCGSPENLEIAEYVHGFLTDTAERLWREHKKAHGLRSDRDRRTYVAGVMTGFAEKLRHQAKQNTAQGLVWVKDGDLEGYFRRRHPYVRHFRYAGQQRNESYAHGRAAGRRIVLHRAVSTTTEERGRLLPGTR
jgi:predicted SprT family Zn-dependent metalloprotease